MNWLQQLEAPFRGALESGNYLVALSTVFLAGVATSLTPCVYPMIAITVSVFGAREAPSKAHAAGLSTLFVLGMTVLFTPLGVVAAVTGGVFGSVLSHPAVLVGLAALFVLLALSMFGLFEMALPPSAHNRLAQMGGAGWKGAFALGFVSALVAAPCTGPVLAFLLGWIGTTGNIAFGGVALFVYALGLGLLFWLVGTFAVGLPKSGRWLEWVKSVFGIVMLVVAVYYVRDLLPFDRPAEKDAVWLYAGIGTALAGIMAGAIHLSFHSSRVLVRWRKAGAIALAVLGSFAMLTYAEGLPPGAKIEWEHDYAQAKAIAEDNALPLLIDFGASWCAACGELDRHTLSDPRVVQEVKQAGMVAVKVDLSPGQDTAEKKELLASYNQKGLPLIVLHGTDGKELARVTTFVEPEEFLGFLRTSR